jgi:hypothetical protein
MLIVNIQKPDLAEFALYINGRISYMSINTFVIQHYDADVTKVYVRTKLQKRERNIFGFGTASTSLKQRAYLCCAVTGL